MGRAFYPTFVLIYPIGTIGNTNIPYNAPHITAAILADKTNTVSIPKLESIATNFAYIMLVNNSSFSLTLNEGSLEKSPLGGGSSLINNGQNASYEITPNSVSAYSVLRNGSTPIAFPTDLSEFRSGIVYVLTYNGTALTVTNQLPINTEITVPGNNLAMKLTWLKSYILSNKSYFIEVTADENIAPQNLSYSGKSDISIILNGGGTMRTVNLSGNGNLFAIGSGVTLILNNNITLKGRSDNNTSLVYINGGALVMNAGTIITGNTYYSYFNYNTQSNGGGIWIKSGTFIMNGGEITGNTANAYCSSTDSYNSYDSCSYGGGVFVENGNFTMKGGKISGNTASASASHYMSRSYSWGGGVYVYGGTFIMNGGEISDNTATDTLYSAGGGVFVDNNGTFRISVGVIYGINVAESLRNTARGGAVLVNNGVAQYGTFIGDTFYRLGDLSTTNTTIRVVNGNLLTE